jgi:hypothetical protein
VIESFRRLARLAVVPALALAVTSCARPGPTDVADRGIGGTGVDTGIVGVITGFGSVRVDGLEVGDDTLRDVTIDGESRPVAALQVGQIARIVASGEGSDLHARSIAIEHEVSGPVRRALARDVFLVAGQTVRLTAATIGTMPPVGRWVAVSGLRDADGVVRATRLDTAAPGEAIIVGRLSREAGAWRIEGLSLAMSGAMSGAETLDGQRVRVVGRMSGSVLAPRLLVQAPLLPGPTEPNVLIVQAFAQTSGDAIRLGDGDYVARGPGFGALPHDGPVVVAITRAPDGHLTATGLLGSGESGGRGGGPSGVADPGRGGAPSSDPGATGGHAGATGPGTAAGGSTNTGTTNAGSARGEVATVGAAASRGAGGARGGDAGVGGGGPRGGTSGGGGGARR